jgi:hypothetical protein
MYRGQSFQIPYLFILKYEFLPTKLLDKEKKKITTYFKGFEFWGGSTNGQRLQ